MERWNTRFCIGLCAAALSSACGSTEHQVPSSQDAASPPDSAQTLADLPFRLDGRYTSSPDGRQFLIVDYCLPIRPLTEAARYCPGTIDEARTALGSALDAGAADAHPYGGPELSMDCVEPVIVYSPNGRNLAWNWLCYYDSTSGNLLSVMAGSDTPTECVGSPLTDTAAWIANVYGQAVTCTRNSGQRG